MLALTFLYPFQWSGWKFAPSFFFYVYDHHHAYDGCHNDDLTFFDFSAMLFPAFEDYDAMHMPRDDDL